MKTSHSSYQQRHALGRYKFGNTCGRLLAGTIHPRPPQTFIPSIKKSSGEITSDPQSLQQTFREYFSALYNLAPPPFLEDKGAGTHHIEEYVQETAIPILDDDKRKSLDCPFLHKELLGVIADIPSGKSRGPDGFTQKFYKPYKEHLSPFMLQVFNSISSSNQFPVQTPEAHITLIPKPEKDDRYP